MNDMHNLMASSSLAWIDLNNIVTENQKVIEFSNHRFLIDPIADMHPDQVYRKSAQVGMSTAKILKTIHSCKYMHTNIGYVLPSQNIIKDFVTPKVDPIIDSNPVIRNMVSKDSVTLKQFGERFIYYRGAFSEREAIAISLDILVLDELDRMPNQSVINTYDSRLQASEFGYRWRLSNPSTPGFGVSEYFDDSDQRHWFVTCEACGHEWYLDFELDPDEKNHYIDIKTATYRCGKCNKEISNDARRDGRWVQKYPKRDYRHGYWMSQLMAPWVTAKRIIEQRDESSTEFFYNFVLGKPFQSADLLIDRESILNANTPKEPVLRNVVMGSDIGKPHWYCLGTPDGIFEVGHADSWEQLEYLFKLYKCEAWVMDSMPEFTKVQEMLRKYPGQAFACQFNKDRAANGIIRWQEGEKRGFVYADRTKVIDRVVTEINNKAIKFLQKPQDLEMYISHSSNMYRTIETDTKGLMKIDWQTKEGRPDHLVFATVYWRIALEKAFSSFGNNVVQTIQSANKPLAPVVANGKISVKFDIQESIERATR